MNTTDYIKILQDCKVGEFTANFIACKMLLNDLHDKMYEARAAMYAGNRTYEWICNNYLKEHQALEAIIDAQIIESITDKLQYENLTEI